MLGLRGIRDGLDRVGPGIVAGASNNDPTTIATLIVVGSTTVYGLSWLVVLLIPMLATIQSTSAAIGVIAGTGLQGAIRQRYGRWSIVPLVAIVAVTLVTLAADLEAGAAALALFTGIDYRWFVVPFTIGVGTLFVVGGYATIERPLKCLAVVFLAFVASAILAKPHWPDVLYQTAVPTVQFSPAFTSCALALLGTTLTSYVYVWESIAVAERKPVPAQLRNLQWDAIFGMVFLGVTAFFVVVGTGATLGVRHMHVETAQDAAVALAPLAGPFAAALFGLGLLASSMVAIPVLTGTTMYVLAETFDWAANPDRPAGTDPRFSAAMVASLAVAVAVALVGVNPITLLFWSSVAGGLCTPLTLALLMLIARDRQVMGSHRIGVRLATAGWAVTLVVSATCIAFLWQIPFSQ